MKKRSGKNLIRFFYHLLVVLVMAMPMLSGLVRVIYVQSNKNATDSYYGETINVSTEYVANDVNSLVVGQTYYVTGFNTGPTSILLGRDNTTLYASKLIYGTEQTLYENVYFFIFRGVDYSSSYFYLYYIGGERILGDVDTSNVTFNFTLLDNFSLTQSAYSSYSNKFKYVVGNMYSFLDNAFDYSLYKTMQDFTFHSDFRFTDIANGMLMTFDNNNLYIQYINFYINWLLTTAVISFAPYVLLSFYHLAIGILDKFMKKGEEL